MSLSEAYTGGCACGALRYQISGEPLVSVDCQCRDCQSESGTGHQSHLTFPRAAAHMTGEAAGWEMRGDSGRSKTRWFCPTCGSPLYMTFPENPDLFTVRAASLDDPGRYRPQMVLYRSSAHVWDKVDPDLPSFDKMPPA